MLALSPTFDGKRTIPSAAITEIMANLLDLKPSDKLMEIGTGSAYQTEKWAESGCEVHSIELEPYVDPTIVTGDYIYLHSGDGRLGIPSEAPFTAIVATCGVSEIPDVWRLQLAPGGRLVIPIGDSKVQRLTLIRAGKDNQLTPERIGAYVRFQMLRTDI